MEHAAIIGPLEDDLTVKLSAPADAAAPPFPLDLNKLAHELRTPIGAIVALSEVMRDERFGALGNARYTGYANDIHQSARHALAVLSAMLEAEPGPDGRADSRGQMIFEQLELNTIARSCVSGLQPIAAKSGIHLRTALHPRPLSLRADRRSLKQIVLNLLSNALKFTPAGGTVTVATSIGTSDVDTSAPGHFRLDVRDTGVGMPPTLIADLLGRDRNLTMAQGMARGATDRPPDGRTQEPLPAVGIGLPLARDLAAAIGGHLSIKSDTDGTTVSLHLPNILRRADAQATDPLGD